jgi:dipeptidyl-peptidase 4
MKTLIYILMLCCFTTNLLAQKKDFTMQEAVMGLSTTLAPANLKQLKWTGDEKYFAHVVFNDSQEHIVRYNVENFNTDTILSLAKLNKIVRPSYDSLSKIPTINWITGSTFYYNSKNKYIMVDILKETTTLLYALPADAENETINSNTLDIAYTLKNNVYVNKVGDSTAIPITMDGSDNLLNGTSVHRDEFGITGGLFWSNKGDKIAYYKMDQSMVTNYPIIDWKTVPASMKNIKYPFSGGVSHHVKLYAYNFASKTTTPIATEGPADQYLTCVTWTPDDANIYVGVLNRDQNNLQLNKYNALDGKLIRNAIIEKSKKYVEPQHPLYFLKDMPSKFIWWSQKDGYMHLYLIDEKEDQAKQITKGKFLVNEILGFNNTTNELIITSTYNSPLEKNIYAVDITNNDIRRINQKAGTHNALCNANSSYVLDVYSNKEDARNIELLSVNGDIEKRILTANNPIANYNVATVKNLELFSTDSIKLYAKLMLPHNFDASKKYPVIVYLYNGPHVQLINNKFPESGNLWYDYLTQRGYIVYVMDGRGSSNRGLAFENATFKQLGTVEMEDQMVGINYLKSLQYVDTSKMGIHGWSFGGFMTTSFMLRKPDVFKVGVAGGPVMDWSKYEIMYTERYMDSPDSNATGYEANNLLTKTKNLKGKLLIIHGTDDDVVVWQHSQLFLKNCVDNGVPIDYFNYPGHAHNVRGKDRVHLMQKITDYFDLYLKP